MEESKKIFRKYLPNTSLLPSTFCTSCNNGVFCDDGNGGDNDDGNENYEDDDDAMRSAPAVIVHSTDISNKIDQMLSLDV